MSTCPVDQTRSNCFRYFPERCKGPDQPNPPSAGLVSGLPGTQQKPGAKAKKAAARGPRSWTQHVRPTTTTRKEIPTARCPGHFSLRSTPPLSTVLAHSKAPGVSQGTTTVPQDPAGHPTPRRPRRFYKSGGSPGRSSFFREVVLLLLL